jgi:glycosyltransferase involved in cell wall biosynthesis
VGIEKTGVKSVVTVHDLIFLRFPEFYNSIDAKIYYWKLAHACRVADHIVAISNQTKKDLIRFLMIPSEKISVIYQGCNPIYWESFKNEAFQDVRIRYNLPDRYLLYLGTIEERKNLLGIVKAMHVKNISIPLVVIGRKVDGYFQKVLNYISVNKISNVIFTERISSQDLPGIYQNAECFIYPSFFEGFGIPLLEALVSKIPVITSRRGCFAEAAGPGSIYVDPYDPEEIGDAIIRVISNDKIRDRMIAEGTAYADNFKDEVIAKKYNKLYHSLINKS